MMPSLNFLQKRLRRAQRHFLYSARKVTSFLTLLCFLLTGTGILPAIADSLTYTLDTNRPKPVLKINIPQPEIEIPEIKIELPQIQDVADMDAIKAEIETLVEELLASIETIEIEDVQLSIEDATSAITDVVVSGLEELVIETEGTGQIGLTAQHRADIARDVSAALTDTVLAVSDPGQSTTEQLTAQFGSVANAMAAYLGGTSDTLVENETELQDVINELQPNIIAELVSQEDVLPGRVAEVLNTLETETLTEVVALLDSNTLAPAISEMEPAQAAVVMNTMDTENASSVAALLETDVLSNTLTELTNTNPQQAGTIIANLAQDSQTRIIALLPQGTIDTINQEAGTEFTQTGQTSAEGTAGTKTLIEDQTSAEGTAGTKTLIEDQTSAEETAGTKTLIEDQTSAEETAGTKTLIEESGTKTLIDDQTEMEESTLGTVLESTAAGAATKYLIEPVADTVKELIGMENAEETQIAETLTEQTTTSTGELVEIEGQTYALNSEEGQAFLNTEAGQVYLDTEEGQQYLETEAGQTFLETEGGQQYLETTSQPRVQVEGQRYALNSVAGQEFLTTEEGQAYLDTEAGQEYLETAAGQTFLETAGGQQYLETTSNPRVETDGQMYALNSEAGQEFLNTEAGRVYLDTEEGQQYLETEAGQTFLETEGGQQYLEITSQPRVQVEGQRYALNSEAGQEFLTTEEGQKYLETEEGQKYLESAGGEAYLEQFAANLAEMEPAEAANVLNHMADDKVNAVAALLDTDVLANALTELTNSNPQLAGTIITSLTEDSQTQIIALLSQDTLNTISQETGIKFAQQNQDDTTSDTSSTDTSDTQTDTTDTTTTDTTGTQTPDPANEDNNGNLPARDWGPSEEELQAAMEAGLTETRYADGTRAEFTYHANGEVTVELNRSTSDFSGYDDEMRSTYIRTANTTTLTYNDQGLLIREESRGRFTDGYGLRTIIYSYDDEGRLVSKEVTGPNSHQRYTYDPSSNRLTKYENLEAGTSMEYTYDDSGRLTSTTDQDGTEYNVALPPSTSVGMSYTFDENGRVLTATSNGDVYTYDEQGRVITINYSDGTRVEVTAWDNQGRATKGTISESVTQTWGRDEDRETTFMKEKGEIFFQYNENGLLHGQATTDPKGKPINWTYFVYDESGQIQESMTMDNDGNWSYGIYYNGQQVGSIDKDHNLSESDDISAEARNHLISRYYEIALGREATDSDLTQMSALAAAEGIDAVSQTITESREYVSYQISSTYESLMGVEISDTELQGHLDYLVSIGGYHKFDSEAFSDDLKNSSAFINGDAFDTYIQNIAARYLRRELSEAEVEHHRNLVLSGEMSVGDFEKAFMENRDYRSNPASEAAMADIALDYYGIEDATTEDFKNLGWVDANGTALTINQIVNGAKRSDTYIWSVLENYENKQTDPTYYKKPKSGWSLGNIIKIVVITVISVVASVFTAGALAPLMGTLMATVVAGALVGGLTAAINGGDIGQGMLMGGILAGVGQAISTVAQGISAAVRAAGQGIEAMATAFRETFTSAWSTLMETGKSVLKSMVTMAKEIISKSITKTVQSILSETGLAQKWGAVGTALFMLVVSAVASGIAEGAMAESNVSFSDGFRSGFTSSLSGNLYGENEGQFSSLGAAVATNVVKTAVTSHISDQMKDDNPFLAAFASSMAGALVVGVGYMVSESSVFNPGNNSVADAPGTGTDTPGPAPGAQPGDLPGNTAATQNLGPESGNVGSGTENGVLGSGVNTGPLPGSGDPAGLADFSQIGETGPRGISVGNGLEAGDTADSSSLSEFGSRTQNNIPDTEQDTAENQAGNVSGAGQGEPNTGSPAISNKNRSALATDIQRESSDTSGQASTNETGLIPEQSDQSRSAPSPTGLDKPSENTNDRVPSASVPESEDNRPQSTEQSRVADVTMEESGDTSRPTSGTQSAINNALGGQTDELKDPAPIDTTTPADTQVDPVTGLPTTLENDLPGQTSASLAGKNSVEGISAENVNDAREVSEADIERRVDDSEKSAQKGNESFTAAEAENADVAEENTAQKADPNAAEPGKAGQLSPSESAAAAQTGPQSESAKQNANLENTVSENTNAAMDAGRKLFGNSISNILTSGIGPAIQSAFEDMMTKLFVKQVFNTAEMAEEQGLKEEEVIENLESTVNSEIQAFNSVGAMADAWNTVQASFTYGTSESFKMSANGEKIKEVTITKMGMKTTIDEAGGMSWQDNASPYVTIKEPGKSAYQVDSRTGNPVSAENAQEALEEFTQLTTTMTSHGPKDIASNAQFTLYEMTGNTQHLQEAANLAAGSTNQQIINQVDIAQGNQAVKEGKYTEALASYAEVANDLQADTSLPESIQGALEQSAALGTESLITQVSQDENLTTTEKNDMIEQADTKMTDLLTSAKDSYQKTGNTAAASRNGQIATRQAQRKSREAQNSKTVSEKNRETKAAEEYESLSRNAADFISKSITEEMSVKEQLARVEQLVTIDSDYAKTKAQDQIPSNRNILNSWTSEEQFTAASLLEKADTTARSTDSRVQTLVGKIERADLTQSQNLDLDLLDLKTTTSNNRQALTTQVEAAIAQAATQTDYDSLQLDTQRAQLGTILSEEMSVVDTGLDWMNAAISRQLESISQDSLMESAQLRQEFATLAYNQAQQLTTSTALEDREAASTLLAAAADKLATSLDAYKAQNASGSLSVLVKEEIANWEATYQSLQMFSDTLQILASDLQPGGGSEFGLSGSAADIVSQFAANPGLSEKYDLDENFMLNGQSVVKITNREDQSYQLFGVTDTLTIQNLSTAAGSSVQALNAMQTVNWNISYDQNGNVLAWGTNDQIQHPNGAMQNAIFTVTGDDVVLTATLGTQSHTAIYGSWDQTAATIPGINGSIMYSSTGEMEVFYREDQSGFIVNGVDTQNNPMKNLNGGNVVQFSSSGVLLDLAQAETKAANHLETALDNANTANHFERRDVMFNCSLTNAEGKTTQVALQDHQFVQTTQGDRAGVAFSQTIVRNGSMQTTMEVSWSATSTIGKGNDAKTVNDFSRTVLYENQRITNNETKYTSDGVLTVITEKGDFTPEGLLQSGERTSTTGNQSVKEDGAFYTEGARAGEFRDGTRTVTLTGAKQDVVAQKSGDPVSIQSDITRIEKVQEGLVQERTSEYTRRVGTTETGQTVSLPDTNIHEKGDFTSDGILRFGQRTSTTGNQSVKEDGAFYTEGTRAGEIRDGTRQLTTRQKDTLPLEDGTTVNFNESVTTAKLTDGRVTEQEMNLYDDGNLKYKSRFEVETYDANGNPKDFVQTITLYGVVIEKDEGKTIKTVRADKTTVQEVVNGKPKEVNVYTKETEIISERKKTAAESRANETTATEAGNGWDKVTQAQDEGGGVLGGSGFVESFKQRNTKAEEHAQSQAEETPATEEKGIIATVASWLGIGASEEASRAAMDTRLAETGQELGEVLGAEHGTGAGEPAVQTALPEIKTDRAPALSTSRDRTVFNDEGQAVLIEKYINDELIESYQGIDGVNGGAIEFNEDGSGIVTGLVKNSEGESLIIDNKPIIQGGKEITVTAVRETVNAGGNEIETVRSFTVTTGYGETKQFNTDWVEKTSGGDRIINKISAAGGHIMSSWDSWMTSIPDNNFGDNLLHSFSLIGTAFVSGIEAVAAVVAGPLEALADNTLREYDNIFAATAYVGCKVVAQNAVLIAAIAMGPLAGTALIGGGILSEMKPNGSGTSFIGVLATIGGAVLNTAKHFFVEPFVQIVGATKATWNAYMDEGTDRYAFADTIVTLASVTIQVAFAIHMAKGPLNRITTRISKTRALTKVRNSTQLSRAKILEVSSNIMQSATRSQVQSALRSAGLKTGSSISAFSRLGNLSHTLGNTRALRATRNIGRQIGSGLSWTKTNLLQRPLGWIKSNTLGILGKTINTLAIKPLARVTNRVMNLKITQRLNTRVVRPLSTRVRAAGTAIKTTQRAVRIAQLKTTIRLGSTAAGQVGRFSSSWSSRITVRVNNARTALSHQTGPMLRNQGGLSRGNQKSSQLLEQNVVATQNNLITAMKSGSSRGLYAKANRVAQAEAAYGSLLGSIGNVRLAKVSLEHMDAATAANVLTGMFRSSPRRAAEVARALSESSTVSGKNIASRTYASLAADSVLATKLLNTKSIADFKVSSKIMEAAAKNKSALNSLVKELAKDQTAMGNAVKASGSGKTSARLLDAVFQSPRGSTVSTRAMKQVMNAVAKNPELMGQVLKAATGNRAKMRSKLMELASETRQLNELFVSGLGKNSKAMSEYMKDAVRSKSTKAVKDLTTKVAKDPHASKTMGNALQQKNLSGSAKQAFENYLTQQIIKNPGNKTMQQLLQNFSQAAKENILGKVKSELAKPGEFAKAETFRKQVVKDLNKIQKTKEGLSGTEAKLIADHMRLNGEVIKATQEVKTSSGKGGKGGKEGENAKSGKADTTAQPETLAAKVNNVVNAFKDALNIKQYGKSKDVVDAAAAATTAPFRMTGHRAMDLARSPLELGYTVTKTISGLRLIESIGGGLARGIRGAASQFRAELAKEQMLSQKNGFAKMAEAITAKQQRMDAKLEALAQDVHARGGLSNNLARKIGKTQQKMAALEARKNNLLRMAEQYVEQAHFAQGELSRLNLSNLSKSLRKALGKEVREAYAEQTQRLSEANQRFKKAEQQLDRESPVAQLERTRLKLEKQIEQVDAGLKQAKQSARKTSELLTRKKQLQARITKTEAKVTELQRNPTLGFEARRSALHMAKAEAAMQVRSARAELLSQGLRQVRQAAAKNTEAVHSALSKKVQELADLSKQSSKSSKSRTEYDVAEQTLLNQAEILGQQKTMAEAVWKSISGKNKSNGKLQELAAKSLERLHPREQAEIVNKAGANTTDVIGRMTSPGRTDLARSLSREQYQRVVKDALEKAAGYEKQAAEYRRSNNREKANQAKENAAKQYRVTSDLLAGRSSREIMKAARDSSYQKVFELGDAPVIQSAKKTQGQREVSRSTLKNIESFKKYLEQQPMDISVEKALETYNAKRNSRAKLTTKELGLKTEAATKKAFENEFKKMVVSKETIQQQAISSIKTAAARAFKEYYKNNFAKNAKQKVTFNEALRRFNAQRKSVNKSQLSRTELSKKIDHIEQAINTKNKLGKQNALSEKLADLEVHNQKALDQFTSAQRKNLQNRVIDAKAKARNLELDLVSLATAGKAKSLASRWKQVQYRRVAKEINSLEQKGGQLGTVPLANTLKVGRTLRVLKQESELSVALEMQRIAKDLKGKSAEQKEKLVDKKADMTLEGFTERWNHYKEVLRKTKLDITEFKNQNKALKTKLESEIPHVKNGRVKDGYDFFKAFEKVRNGMISDGMVPGSLKDARLLRVYSEIAFSRVTGYEGMRLAQKVMLSEFFAGKNVGLRAGGGKTNPFIMFPGMSRILTGKSLRAEILVDDAPAIDKYINEKQDTGLKQGDLAKAFGVELVNGNALHKANATGKLIEALNNPNRVVIFDHTTRAHLRNAEVTNRRLREALSQTNHVGIDEVHMAATSQTSAIIGGNVSKPKVELVRTVDSLLNQLGFNAKTFESAQQRGQLGRGFKVQDFRGKTLSDAKLTEFNNSTQKRIFLLDGEVKLNYAARKALSRFTDGQISSVLRTLYSKTGKAGEYNAYEFGKDGNIYPVDHLGKVQYEQISNDIVGQITAARKHGADPYHSVRVNHTSMQTSMSAMYAGNFGAKIVGASGTIAGIENLMKSKIGSGSSHVSTSMLNIQDMVRKTGGDVLDVQNLARADQAVIDAVKKGWDAAVFESSPVKQQQLVEKYMKDMETQGVNEAVISVISAQGTGFYVRKGQGKSMLNSKAFRELLKASDISVKNAKLREGKLQGFDYIDVQNGVQAIVQSHKANPKTNKKVFLEKPQITIFNEQGAVGKNFQNRFTLVVRDAHKMTADMLTQTLLRTGRPNARGSWDTQRFIVVDSQAVKNTVETARSASRKNEISQLFKAKNSGTKNVREQNANDRLMMELLESKTSKLTDLVKLNAEYRQLEMVGDSTRFAVQDTFRDRIVVDPLKQAMRKLTEGSRHHKIIDTQMSNALNRSASGADLKLRLKGEKTGRELNNEYLRNNFDLNIREGQRIWRNIMLRSIAGFSWRNTRTAWISLRSMRQAVNTVKSNKVPIRSTNTNFAEAKNFAELYVVGKNLMDRVLSKETGGREAGALQNQAVQIAHSAGVGRVNSTQRKAFENAWQESHQQVSGISSLAGAMAALQTQDESIARMAQADSASAALNILRVNEYSQLRAGLPESVIFNQDRLPTLNQAVQNINVSTIRSALNSVPVLQNWFNRDLALDLEMQFVGQQVRQTQRTWQDADWRQANSEQVNRYSREFGQDWVQPALEAKYGLNVSEAEKYTQASSGVQRYWLKQQITSRAEQQYRTAVQNASRVETHLSEISEGGDLVYQEQIMDYHQARAYVDEQNALAAELETRYGFKIVNPVTKAWRTIKDRPLKQMVQLWETTVSSDMKAFGLAAVSSLVMTSLTGPTPWALLPLMSLGFNLIKDRMENQQVEVGNNLGSKLDTVTVRPDLPAAVPSTTSANRVQEQTVDGRSILQRWLERVNEDYSGQRAVTELADLWEEYGEDKRLDVAPEAAQRGFMHTLAAVLSLLPEQVLRSKQLSEIRFGASTRQADVVVSDFGAFFRNTVEQALVRQTAEISTRVLWSEKRKNQRRELNDRLRDLAERNPLIREMLKDAPLDNLLAAYITAFILRGEELRVNIAELKASEKSENQETAQETAALYEEIKSKFNGRDITLAHLDGLAGARGAFEVQAARLSEAVRETPRAERALKATEFEEIVGVSLAEYRRSHRLPTSLRLLRRLSDPDQLQVKPDQVLAFMVTRGYALAAALGLLALGVSLVAIPLALVLGAGALLVGVTAAMFQIQTEEIVWRLKPQHQLEQLFSDQNLARLPGDNEIEQRAFRNMLQTGSVMASMQNLLLPGSQGLINEQARNRVMDEFFKAAIKIADPENRLEQKEKQARLTFIFRDLMAALHVPMKLENLEFNYYGELSAQVTPTVEPSLSFITNPRIQRTHRRLGEVGIKLDIRILLPTKPIKQKSTDSAA